MTTTAAAHAPARLPAFAPAAATVKGVVPVALPGAAARLSAVAADLAAALGNEEADPLAPMRHLDRACELLDALSWAMCREPAGFPAGGLREIARALAAELHAGSQGSLTDDDAADVQVRAVTAQAGELAHAYRRWAAAGGRPGARHDLVEDGIAHLLITTAILAEMTGIDIDRAIGRKVTVTRSPGSDPAALAPAGTGTS
jgi:hypothetical protein